MAAFTSIDFFICPHGFGHIRRVLKVVKTLLKNHTTLQVALHVNAAHLAGFQSLLPEWDTDPTQSFPISWITDTMAHCPDFSNPEYSTDVYEKWVKTLKVWMDAHKNSLVVSDNLVTPAFYANRALLMGSFLWSSVVSKDYLPAYQAFGASEKWLLQQRKFNMLALEDMAMPDVRMLTQMIPMPWFCNQQPAASSLENGSKFRVLLSVGGTSKGVNKGLELLALLKRRTDIEWQLDRRLYQAMSYDNEHIRLFDFSEQAFQALDLVIARPGIGILTDCISYRIPIVAIGENSNAELAHNSKVIAAKGWGWNWLEEHTEELTAQKFEEILQREKLNAAKNKLALAVCGGAGKAADFVLSELNTFSN